MLDYIHAGLMCCAFALLFAGFVTARYLRQKRFWLKVHRAFGLWGVASMILALAAIAVRISLDQGRHLDVPHAWVGCGVAVLVAAQTLIGFLQLRVRQRSAMLRSIHRPLGKTVIALMAANIALGLKMVGLI